MIPKIVHNIWIQGYENMPEKEAQNLEKLKTLNPQYTFFFWDEIKIISLLKKYPSLLNCYKKLQQNNNTYQFRSDIARYVIMFEYGGIYCDLDFNCISSFDKLFLNKEKSDIYVAYNENTFLNNINIFNLLNTPKYGSYFMAFTEKHPLWLNVFEIIINAKNNLEIGFALDESLQKSNYKIVFLDKIKGHYQCDKFSRDAICFTPTESTWNPVRPMLKFLNCNQNIFFLFIFIFIIIVLFIIYSKIPLLKNPLLKKVEQKYKSKK